MKTQNTLTFRIAVATVYTLLVSAIAIFVAISFELCPANIEGFLK